MKIILAILLILCTTCSQAKALFLIENDDLKRPGKPGISFGQIAKGTAVNFSWGLTPETNTYLIFGTGAGLGLKYRLVNEKNHTPLSADLFIENNSLQGASTAVLGTTLWKNITHDIVFLLQYEIINNQQRYPGLENKNEFTLTSCGVLFKLWRSSSFVIKTALEKNPFGTIGLNIIL